MKSPKTKEHNPSIVSSCRSLKGKGWIIALAAALSEFLLFGFLCTRGLREELNVPYLLKCAGFLLVAFSLLYAALSLLVVLLEREPKERKRARHSRAFDFIFEKHSIMLPFIIILAFWIPWLIIAFPGTTDPNDCLDQLRQWHGMETTSSKSVYLRDPEILINNHHPILHTALLNLAVDLGGMLGSQNLGLFGYVLVQTVLYSGTLAFGFALMREFCTPAWMRILSLGIYCLCPAYGAWTVSVTKDVIFTVFMVQFVLFLMLALHDPKRASRPKALVLFAVITVLMCLLRNNGIYSAFLALPLLLLVKEHRSELRSVSLMGLSAVAVAFCVMHVLYPAWGFAGASVREMLSVPFQQTARYIVEHPDEVSDAERKTIDTVLPYEKIQDNYNPGLSDPIKNRYRKKGGASKLVPYLKTWALMGLKHPDTYARAFLENTYEYYYPGTGAGWAWLNMNHYANGLSTQSSNTKQYRESGFDLYQTDTFVEQRDAAILGYEAYRATPIISLPGDMAFCNWVLIVCLFLVLRRGRARDAIPLVPLLVLFLVVLLGPDNGNIRYMLPMIASMPLMAAWLVRCYRVL